ncbi:MAG TPA: glycosyltransferase family 39 protein [Bryobacteraceae bacterium]|nr:glycosyltransferase family 39 protein [Bryobacteraceae bacterium]
MNRAKSAAWWITPSLLCLVVYWPGMKAWFRADDFAWLGLGLDVHTLHDLLRALFAPLAQGTIRPWSERVFFMGLYALFGLDSLPFRICVFATQFANLALVASIARRLTGSSAAGWWAAVFWLVNSSQGQVMSWNSAYNQVLCGLFMLSAFHCLLRYCETGRRGYWIAQWVFFLLGFGALELNIVYPVLAALYAVLFARRHFRRVLPLFIPSLLFAGLHRIVAPVPAAGVYAPHLDFSILRTLGTYWAWTVGPTWGETPLEVPAWFIPASIVLLTAAILTVVIASILRRQWLPLFFLAWFVIVISPLLPFRDHITEYYPFLPAIGLAMLGGWAFAAAWRRPVAWEAVAVLVGAVYVAANLPSARTACEWTWERSLLARKVVLGVLRAHELHPDKIILLDDVDGEVFWNAILDHPFRLIGLRGVYLTPGTEQRVGNHPEWGDPMEFVLPPEATEHALEQDRVVVYSVAGPRLRNITARYPGIFRAHYTPSVPRRVDAANPLLAYLLGPTWYEIDQNHRWMPRQATVRLGAPSAPGQELYLTGVCPDDQLRNGPLPLQIRVDGIPLPPVRINPGSNYFEFSLQLPASLVGRPSVEVSIEVGRTFRPPADGRELGLTFGTFEVR